MKLVLILVGLLLATLAQAPAQTVLPAGYLSVSGNQIKDGNGNNVRISSAQFTGGPNDGTMQSIRNAGFNAVRIPWRDQALTLGGGNTGCDTLAHMDTCVANAAAASLKVILEHLGNEIAPSTGGCFGRQQNGLWFDSGGSSGNDDGCGDGHNVTYANFKANTVSLLTRYNNNSTVIGYEFHHEPVVNGVFTGGGNFRVSGGQLLGPTGTAVNLLGVDLYSDNGFGGGPNQNGGPTFQLTTTMSDTTNCLPLLSFYPNISFVRFQVGRLGTLDTNALPTAARLQPYINCLTNKHIVVAVDYHDYQFSLNDSLGGSGQVTLSTVEAWQNSLSLANAGNPYFWQMTQNEPQDTPSGSYQPMVRALYSAIRNVWMKNTKYYPGDNRNNGVNNYTQTAGALNASCVSSPSGTGPSGTGSSISDGSCSWNFVGAAVAGNVAPILVTTIGGAAWGLIDTNTVGDMTNILYDWHLYSWQWCSNGCSSDVGTSVTDQAVNQGVIVAGPLSSGSNVNSQDGVVPVFFGEDGPGPAGDCNRPAIDPSWPSIVNSIANGHTRVSSRIAGGGLFYHNWAFNICGFTTGNFDADSPVSLTSAGVTANNAIAAGNGPVQPGGGNPAVNWAGGGDTDIFTACNDVGGAVNAVNSGVIIFCDGPVNNSVTLLNGNSLTTASGMMDLSNAGAHLVGGGANQPPTNKTAYAVDLYPTNVQNVSPDSGAGAVTAWNTFWGYLEKNGTAPVVLMETGCSCDNTNGALTDDTNWASLMVSYTSGTASNGPTFSTGQQGMGWNWWAWQKPSGNPDGLLNTDGTIKAAQQTYWSQILYGASVVTPPAQLTTWNPGDKTSGISLSNSNNLATVSSAGQNSVRATASKTTGKYCFAVIANTVTANWDAGIADATFNLASAAGLGSDTHGIGFDPSSTGGLQGIFFNNVLLSSGATGGSNGDENDFCIDFGASLLWVSSPVMRAASQTWNNSGTATPATGTGGLSFSGMTCPCFPIMNELDSTGAATLQTTGTLATGALPSGFSLFDTVVVNHPITTVLN